MEEQRKQPRILPQKAPKKSPLVDPIVAGEMRCDEADGIVTDPDGSYTGRPLDGGKPVQDADDL